MSENICYKSCNINDQVTELITMAKKLKENGEKYLQYGDIKGALYSYSNCSSLLYTVKTLFDKMCLGREKELTDNLFFETDDFLYKLNNNYQDILDKVQQLQLLIKKNNNKKNNTDEISCKEISNISLSGSDCIFFNHVIGLENQKLKIEETFIKPIIYPSLYGKLSKGILFYGPPGTGKTLLVKAAVNTLATAYLLNKISVIFFSPTAADMKGKYVGESEKKIKELFVCAHRKACECQKNDKLNRIFLSVIFIDEIDNIGASRSNDSTGMMKQTVNALLQAMDGVESSKNVIVMGATNNPWELDPALLRRFTSSIFIDLPKKNNIKKLIEKEIVGYMEKKHVDITNCDIKTDNVVEKKKCESDCVEDNKLNDDYWKSMIEHYNNEYNVLFSHSDNVINDISESLETKMNSNSDINQIMNESFSQIADNILKSQTFILSDEKTTNKENIYISAISYKKINSNFDLLLGPEWYSANNFLTSLFGNIPNNDHLYTKYYLSLFSIDKYKSYLKSPYIKINNSYYINLFFCPDRHPMLFNDFKNIHSVYIEKECYTSMVKLKKNNYNFNNTDLIEDRYKLKDADYLKLEKCKILINKQINIVSTQDKIHFNILLKQKHAELILYVMLIDYSRSYIEEHSSNPLIENVSSIKFTTRNSIILIDEEKGKQIEIPIPVDNYNHYDYKDLLKKTDHFINVRNKDIVKNFIAKIFTNVKSLTNDYVDPIRSKQLKQISEMLNENDPDKWTHALGLLVLSDIKSKTCGINLLINILECYITHSQVRIDALYAVYTTITSNNQPFLLEFNDLYLNINEFYRTKGINSIQQSTIDISIDNLPRVILSQLGKIIITEEQINNKVETVGIDNSVINLLQIIKINDNITIDNMRTLGERITADEVGKHLNTFSSTNSMNNHLETKRNIYIECEIDLLNTEFSKYNNYFGTGSIQTLGRGIQFTYDLLKKCISSIWNMLKKIFATLPDIPNESDSNYLDKISESFYETLTTMFQKDIVYLLLANSTKYFYNENGVYKQVNISLLYEPGYSGVLSLLFKALASWEMHTGQAVNYVVEFLKTHLSWIKMPNYEWDAPGNGNPTGSETWWTVITDALRTTKDALPAVIANFIKTIAQIFTGISSFIVTSMTSYTAAVLIIITLFGTWYISPHLKLPSIKTMYFANRLMQDKLTVSKEVYIKVFGMENNKNNLNMLFIDTGHVGIWQQETYGSTIVNYIQQINSNFYNFINQLRYALSSNNSKDNTLLDRELIYTRIDVELTNEQFIVNQTELNLGNNVIYRHTSNDKIILKNYNINLNIIRINAQNKISLINKNDYKKLQTYESNPQEIIKQENEKKKQ